MAARKRLAKRSPDLGTIGGIKGLKRYGAVLSLLVIIEAVEKGK
jgi:hypothetical protein